MAGGNSPKEANDLRNDFTYRLLAGGDIRAGMRVLDVGCGTGDVSFLVAELVGSSGEVVGVDVSEAALFEARRRAALEPSEQTNPAESRAPLKPRAATQFICSNLSDLPQEIGQFDAIVGRRILMYLENPAAIIKYLLGFLKPKGRLIFQESDCSGSGLNDASLPLHTKVQSWIWQTVSAEGGDVHIGMKLYTIMKSCSLEVISLSAEAVVQTAETGSDLAWVTEMMLDRITRHGVAAATEIDVATLTDRLKAEMAKASTPFIRDLAYGIVCTRRT